MTLLALYLIRVLIPMIRVISMLLEMFLIAMPTYVSSLTRIFHFMTLLLVTTLIACLCLEILICMIMVLFLMAICLPCILIMFMTHVRVVVWIYCIILLTLPTHVLIAHCYACNVRYFSGFSNVLTTVCKIMTAVNYLNCDVIFDYCNDILRHFGLDSQCSSLI
jgi:hypothetical protein